MKFATILTSLLIIIAVLIPGKDLPDVGFGGVDKVVHVGMFAVWAIAVRYDLYQRHFPWLLIALAGLFFSTATEALQLLVEGRTFDIYDVIADVIGLVCGLLAGPAVVKWIRSRI